MIRKPILVVAALVATLAAAQARTLNVVFTPPTTGQDGLPLPWASIANFLVYDTSVPAPGVPGLLIATIARPATQPAGKLTLTTPNVSAGNHTIVVVTTDTATPPNPSPPSNAVSVTVPPSGPAAITDLTVTVN